MSKGLAIVGLSALAASLALTAIFLSILSIFCSIVLGSFTFCFKNLFPWLGLPAFGDCYSPWIGEPCHASNFAWLGFSGVLTLGLNYWGGVAVGVLGFVCITTGVLGLVCFGLVTLDALGLLCFGVVILGALGLACFGLVALGLACMEALGLVSFGDLARGLQSFGYSSFSTAGATISSVL